MEPALSRMKAETASFCHLENQITRARAAALTKKDIVEMDRAQSARNWVPLTTDQPADVSFHIVLCSSKRGLGRRPSFVRLPWAMLSCRTSIQPRARQVSKSDRVSSSSAISAFSITSTCPGCKIVATRCLASLRRFRRMRRSIGSNIGGFRAIRGGEKRTPIDCSRRTDLATD